KAVLITVALLGSSALAARIPSRAIRTGQHSTSSSSGFNAVLSPTVLSAFKIYDRFSRLFSWNLRHPNDKRIVNPRIPEARSSLQWMIGQLQAKQKEAIAVSERKTKRKARQIWEDYALNLRALESDITGLLQMKRGPDYKSWLRSAW